MSKKSFKERAVDLWHYFTTYEKIWFFSILILSVIFAFLFPEEDVNGVNGAIIMGLYLADIFLNILCELLISKQSKWNFIVSLFVEITEIAICLVLSYRFATMATTLFFWIPIDIISFINWHRHPDKQEEELTQVRKLSGLAEVLCIFGIFVWTIVVGYFFELCHLLVCHSVGSKVCCESFQILSHFKDLHHVFRGNHRSIGASSRLNGNQTFFFKLSDGFSDRSSADAHLLRKLYFHHSGCGNNGALEDLHLQLLINHLSKRFVILNIEV